MRTRDKERALKESRDKWDNIVDDIFGGRDLYHVISEATQYCGLCSLFLKKNFTCEGCPLYSEKTKKACYEKKPHKIFFKYFQMIKFGEKFPRNWVSIIKKSAHEMNKIVRELKVEDLK